MAIFMARNKLKCSKKCKIYKSFLKFIFIFLKSKTKSGLISYERNKKNNKKKRVLEALKPSQTIKICCIYITSEIHDTFLTALSVSEVTDWMMTTICCPLVGNTLVI